MTAGKSKAPLAESFARARRRQIWLTTWSVALPQRNGPQSLPGVDWPCGFLTPRASILTRADDRGLSGNRPGTQTKQSIHAGQQSRFFDAFMESSHPYGILG